MITIENIVNSSLVECAWAVEECKLFWRHVEHIYNFLALSKGGSNSESTEAVVQCYNM